MTTEEKKEIIIKKFNQNVRGKNSDTSSFSAGHDGSEGHWLERQMGIAANASNTPDILGFEMKNDTTSKTTFGDWSPDIALYKTDLNRDSEFLVIFGHPNLAKGGRYSWSGTTVPKINIYNDYGQKLVVNSDNTISGIYRYSKDTRSNKEDIVPTRYQIEDLEVVKWTSLKTKLERKFNQNGWFKCLKDSTGKYNEIVFGAPINYDSWIDLVKKGVVFFDSGMYQGNNRNYAQWRANNSLWEKLITERY